MRSDAVLGRCSVLGDTRHRHGMDTKSTYDLFLILIFVQFSAHFFAKEEK